MEPHEQPTESPMNDQQPQPPAPQTASVPPQDNPPQPPQQVQPQHGRQQPPAPGQQAPNQQLTSAQRRPVAPPRPQESSFKRGFGLGAGAGLGFGGALLALSIIGSILSAIVMAGLGAAASGMSGAGQTGVENKETVWGSLTAKKKMRAIPVSGPIMTDGGDAGGFALTMGTYGYEVADVLDRMKAEDAEAVVLLMNTPGGTVTGAKAISDAADRYRQRTGKKVYAFVQGMSASGGMYAMAGADEVVSDHGALIGHVGVIMGPFETYTNVTSSGSLLTGEVTAEKIESGYITAGKGKDVGNPFRQMTDDERSMLQGNVDRMYDDFVDHVATKRKIDRNKIVDELGAGLYDEKKAKEVGYIDAVMDRDKAMRHFAEASGLDANDTKLEQNAAPGPWAQIFGAEMRPWGTAPAAKPTEGQPARATTSMCTDRTMPLAWHGSLASVCG